MTPITITTDNFDTEVTASELPVLLDFWAEWCGPCKLIAPTVDTLAERYDGKIKVGKVNVDNFPALAVRFGINSIPTLLLFKGGKLLSSTVGLQSESRLVSFIEQAL